MTGDVVLHPLGHPEVCKEHTAGGRTSKEKHRLVKVQISVIMDVLRARQGDAWVAGLGQQQPVRMQAGGRHSFVLVGRDWGDWFCKGGRVGGGFWLHGATGTVGRMLSE